MIRAKSFVTLGLAAQFITSVVASDSAARVHPDPGTPNRPVETEERAEEAAPQAEREWRDLTLRGTNRISQLFVSFERPGSVRSGVQLYGTVHKDCYDLGIRIVHKQSDSSCFGYNIQATPEAIACMEAHKAAGHGCDRNNECKSLSQVPNSLLGVSTSYTGTVSVASTVPNADVSSPSATRCENFEPTLRFESYADRRAREIREQRRQLQRIRNKSECVEEAQSLASQLCRSGGMSRRECQQFQSRLAGLEFEELKRQVRRARGEDLTETRQALLAFAAEHEDRAPEVIDQFRILIRRSPREDLSDIRDDLSQLASEFGEEHSDRLLWGYHDIAERLIRTRNAGSDEFTEAEDVIADAQSTLGLEIDDVDPEDRRAAYTAATLMSYRGEIRNRLEAEAQVEAMQHGIGFDQFAYENYMGELYNNAIKACSGWSPNTYECQAAQRVLQSAPATFQEAYQRRAQVRQQLALGGGVQSHAGGPFGTAPFTSVPGYGHPQLPGVGGGLPGQYGGPAGYHGYPGQAPMAMGPAPASMPIGIPGGPMPGGMPASHLGGGGMGFIQAPALSQHGFIGS